MLRNFFMLASCLMLSAILALPRTSAHAQDNAVITLDDQTPSVDVVITPTNGAPGVVYAELDGAQLHLLDSAGAETLGLIDKRITAIGIQVAQGATPHTLRLERLPGVSVARVMLTPQTTLPEVSVVSVNQPVKVLDAPIAARIELAPAVSLPVTVNEQNNMITLQFTDQQVTAQITDAGGMVMLTGNGGSSISGLTVRLDVGAYGLTMSNRDLTTKSAVLVSLSNAPALTMSAAMLATPTETPAAEAQPVTVGVCTATVNVRSVNVRSGPGTAYSVLGYAAQNSVLPVGGIAREGGWLLVQTDIGAGWISDTTATLAGSCDSLTTYDIAVRNTQPPNLAQPQPSSGEPTTGGAPATGGGHDDHDDHDEPEGGDDD
jgi:hypothetical protein